MVYFERGRMSGVVRRMGRGEGGAGWAFERSGL